MNSIDKLKKLLERYFEHHSIVAAAYLFGSCVNGKLKEDSDIDIALLLARGRKNPLINWR